MLLLLFLLFSPCRSCRSSRSSNNQPCSCSFVLVVLVTPCRSCLTATPAPQTGADRGQALDAVQVRPAGRRVSISTKEMPFSWIRQY